MRDLLCFSLRHKMAGVIKPLFVSFRGLSRLFGIAAGMVLLSTPASAQLNAGCSAASTANASLGTATSSFSAFSAQLSTSSSSAGLQCQGTLLTVLDGYSSINGTIVSTNASGTTPRLTNGTDFIPYQIFVDPNYSTQVTSGQTYSYYGNPPLLTLLGLNLGPAARIPMYFRIPSGLLNLSAGTYTDTVTSYLELEHLFNCTGRGTMPRCPEHRHQCDKHLYRFCDHHQ